MNVVEIVRTVIGIIFILYGLGVYAYDRTHEMKYSEFRYSPIDWFITIMAGVVASDCTIERGIFFTVIALILWTSEKVILKRMDRKQSKINKIL